MKKLVYSLFFFLSKHPIRYLIIWFFVILGLCSMPGQYIPSTDFFELLKFEKWVHAGIFYVLMLLCLNLIYKNNLSNVYIYLFLLLCIIYGGLLEIMQAKLFSNRSADVLDFIANSFGCIVSFIFHFLYLKKLTPKWNFLNKLSTK
jgi:hypothetical protein